MLRRAGWPRAAYRFAWGPAAPALLQGVFAAARELASHRPPRERLRALELVDHVGSGAPAVAPPAFEVERLMSRAHAAGITGVARSFGDLMRAADGSLRFGSLAAARQHPPGSVRFAAGRDRDRGDFNARFNGSLLTEATARQRLERLAAAAPPGIERPSLDLDAGVPVRSGGSNKAKAVAWDRVNSDVVAPLVADKRVLDLGPRAGAMALMMAQAGAAVVAIEPDPMLAELTRSYAEILEWRDGRRYDLQVLTGDLRIFLSDELGDFAVVTAFCSLHLLPEHDMARIIRKAASMQALLILQANEGVGDDLPGRTLDLHRLLRENGYPHVAVHTPGGFVRPLLVGRP